MGDGIDLLVGMAAKESIAETRDVKPGGSVIYDTSIPGDVAEEDSLAAHIPTEVNGFGVPLTQLANQASGTSQGKNIVAMGALCYLFGLPKEMFLNQVKKLFARKGEKVVAINNTAFQLGYEYMETRYPLNNQF